MAITATYASTAWNTTTSPKTSSTTFAQGDIVVVFATAENNTGDFGTPTATGLTFNLVATAGTPGSPTDTGPMAKMWMSDPAAAGGTQSISLARSGTTFNFGFGRWVVSGAAGRGNSFANLNESTTALAVGAGSAVLYGFGDWANAATDQTIAAGSGTATDRDDAQGTGFSYFLGDWLNTAAGTFNFGVTSYSGLNVAQIGLELTPAPGAAFVKNHTVYSDKASSTTAALVLSTDVPAGNLIVCRMVYDNAATASKPLISSVARAAGETNTWAAAAHSLSTSTTAGAFASGGLTYIRTSVSWPAGTYTVTLDTATVQKAGFYQEFSGVQATAVGTAGSAYSTTTTAANAISGGAAAIGDLLLGFIFGSNVATAPAGSTSTTGGTWGASTGVGSTGGSAATNNFGVGQYKVLTSAGNFSYVNSAAMTAGNGALVIALRAIPTPAITQAAYQFFDDAGTESGAASLAAANTAVTGDISNGDGFGVVRVRLQSTTAVAGDAFDDYTLQWEKNASGLWTNVATLDSLAENYDETNSSTFTTVGSGSVSGLSQSFTGNGQKLSRAGFRLFPNGSPTFNLTAVLYAHSGTLGTSSVPTGAALATSTTVMPAASVGDNWYYFDFDATFTLVNGTNYCIALMSSTVGDASNYICWYADNSTPTHPGNRSTFTGTWAFTTGTDFIFKIYTRSLTPPNTVIAYENPNLTEGGATTNRLGAGTGSFVAGKITEDGTVDDLGWTANNFTEVIYSVKLLQANFVNGDTLRFRVVRNGSTYGMTYTVTPTVNIIQTLPAVTQAAYRWYDEGTETGAVALAAQDTAASGDVSVADGIGQLRVRLQSTTTASLPATDDWQLQWEKNASGSWTNVVGPTLAANYPDTNYAAFQALTSSGQVAIGQSFLGDGKILARAGFYVTRFASYVGTVRAVLYAHTGTFGAGGTATGTALATSTTVIDSTTIGVLSPTYRWLYFDFNRTVTLTNGTPYVIVLEHSGAAGSSLGMGYDNTSPAHAGNAVQNTTGTWAGNVLLDYIFEVFTISAGISTVLAYDSPNLTNGAATTNRLGAGSGSFVAGKISETGLVSDVGWAGNNFTELLYALDIVNTDVVGGDVLRFRILRNGATTGMTFTQVPTLNVTTGPPPQTWAGSTGSIGVAGTSGSFASTTPPVITIYNPTGAITDEEIELGVSGTGFVDGDTIRIAGTTYTTTFISATELFAVIMFPSSVGNLSTTLDVVSVNGTSNAVPFTITVAPSTWTGSTATIGVAGISGAFTSTTTWVGSTATIGVEGASGSFTPGAVSWSGSTATIGAAGISGAFTAGAVSWVGDTATIGVAGTSGAFTAGAVTWTGSTATVGVTATSGTFTPGPIAWPGSTELVFPGITGSYVCKSPHDPTLQLTGDVELVAQAAATTWTPATQQGLLFKGACWGLGIDPAGKLWARFFFSDAPTTAIDVVSSAHSFVNGQRYWIKATRVQSTGLVSFYWAADQTTEPTSWTALGTATAGATKTMYVNTGLTFVGTNAGGAALYFIGRMNRAIIRNGVGGLTLFDVSGDNATTAVNLPTVTYFTCNTGQSLVIQYTAATPSGIAQSVTVAGIGVSGITGTWATGRIIGLWNGQNVIGMQWGSQSTTGVQLGSSPV